MKRIKRCKCSDTFESVNVSVPENIAKKLFSLGYKDSVRQYIAIDKCLVNEIETLWWHGIVTTTCCCGHNVRNFPPHIGVDSHFIDDMRALGYKQYYNPCLPKQRNFFYPKSIKYTLFDGIRNFLWRIKCVFLSLTQ